MYEFSWAWFGVGVVVLAAGIATLKFYDKISDAMGTGAAAYDKWKIAALVMCADGLIMMFNLHSLILNFIAQLFFGGMRGK